MRDRQRGRRLACSGTACRAEGARRTQHSSCCGGKFGRELASGKGDVSDWKVTWARGRGDQLAWPFWEPQAHGISLLFQERIFLTASNYIFTAIFVGEMTLKVVLLPGDLSQPRGPGPDSAAFYSAPRPPPGPWAPGARGSVSQISALQGLTTRQKG